MQALQNITQTYDNNGNLTGDGTWTHTWNYKNQITQSTKAGATTTYAYDYAGNRIKNQESGVTTITPNSFYSITGATTTKHIFANGNLVATIEKTGTSTPTVRYIATDHLGGTSAITNQSGALIESTDYNPYGTIRVDTKVGNYSEKRKYAGTEFDASTGLNYMQARYQNGAQGRFISQDPVFWEVGMTRDGKSVLLNPQAQNSYSYANDNPITNKDITGRCPMCVPIAIGAGLGFVGGVGSEYVGDVINNVNNQGGFSAQALVPQGGFWDTTGRYMKAGVTDAGIGATVAVNPFLGASAAGGFSLYKNKNTDGSLNYSKAVTDAGITLATEGIGKSATQVSGRLPNLGTKAFYTGAHTKQQGTLEAIGLSLNAIFVALTNIKNSLIITSDKKKNK